MGEEIRWFATSKGAPCEIEMIGKSWCDGNYRIVRDVDKANIWVLEYILSGKGTIQNAGSSGQVYYPQAGDIYLLPPGNKQLYYSDAQDPWVKIFVNCRGPVVEGLADAYGLSEKILFTGMSDLSEKFQEIYELMNKRNLSEEFILVRLEMILHEIFRELGRRIQQTRGETDEIRKVRRYLDSHVGQLVSIQEMSDLIYRSPDYLIKHFKAETGMTPYQYLLKRKIQIAERLLRDTVMPVGEVAAQLGYEDAHYFSGLFKKEKGVAPGQFRRSTLRSAE